MLKTDFTMIKVANNLQKLALKRAQAPLAPPAANYEQGPTNTFKEMFNPMNAINWWGDQLGQVGKGIGEGISAAGQGAKTITQGIGTGINAAGQGIGEIGKSIGRNIDNLGTGFRALPQLLPFVNKTPTPAATGGSNNFDQHLNEAAAIRREADEINNNTIQTLMEHIRGEREPNPNGLPAPGSAEEQRMLSFMQNYNFGSPAAALQAYKADKAQRDALQQQKADDLLSKLEESTAN